MRHATLAIVGMLMGGAVGATQKTVDPKLGCRTNPALVGPCFAVEGDVQAWNGNPTFRLHKRGTNRIFGIWSGEHPIAPKCLTDSVSFEKKVGGTFVVCPLSPDKPGHMRDVCVDEVVRARVFESGVGGRWREVATLKGCRIQTLSK